MRTFRRAVGLVAALTVLLSMLTVFSASADARSTRLIAPRAEPITHRLDGLSGGQLLGAEWNIVYSMPITENPFFGTGDLCSTEGRTGRVLIAHAGGDCTVRRGTSLFIFGYSTTCDDVIDPTVDPSLFGKTAVAQRRCAITADRNTEIDAINVRIDEGPTIDIYASCYAVVSPQVRTYLPQDNVYGISARPVSFVAHGWVAAVTGLRAGGQR